MAGGAPFVHVKYWYMWKENILGRRIDLLEVIHNQAHGYFVLKIIGNVNQILPKTLTISALT